MGIEQNDPLRFFAILCDPLRSFAKHLPPNHDPRGIFPVILLRTGARRFTKASPYRVSSGRLLIMLVYDLEEFFPGDRFPLQQIRGQLIHQLAIIRKNF